MEYFPNPSSVPNDSILSAFFFKSLLILYEIHALFSGVVRLKNCQTGKENEINPNWLTKFFKKNGHKTLKLDQTFQK